MTFDLVTDWINWKQWSEVGGYNWYHVVYIFQTAFLCVASVGTAVWTMETITIIVKLFDLHKMGINITENPSDEIKEYPEIIAAVAQEQRFHGIEESSEKLREDVADQEKKLNETEKSSEKLREDPEEQHTRFDQTEQTHEKLREDAEEEEMKLDETRESLEKPCVDNAEDIRLEVTTTSSEKSGDCGDGKTIVETETSLENMEDDSGELEKNIVEMFKNTERKKG